MHTGYDNHLYWDDEDLEDTEPVGLARDQAKIAADQIFDSLASACPVLVAIVIDYAENWDVWQRVGFVRSKQTDRAGNERFVGLPVDIKTIEDYTPYPDVLGDALEYSECWAR